MRTQGLCYVGRHIRTQDYIILRFLRDKLLFRMIGPVVAISKGEMNSKGLSSVLFYLKNLANAETSDALSIQNVPPSELLKLKRNHLLLEIALVSNGTSDMIEVTPLHSGHGLRLDKNKEEIRTFPLLVKNEEFIGVLEQAFQDAS
jgi:hypothetical protein